MPIWLALSELKAVDDWRFAKRMPNRAVAIRELLRRGLIADGFDVAPTRARHFSSDRVRSRSRALMVRIPVVGFLGQSAVQSELLRPLAGRFSCVR